MAADSASGRQARFRRHLHDRRFWIVQALVLGISGGHTALEATRHLGLLPEVALLPVSTYFIPVVYAALNFGVEGAVPTALWCSALTIPNLLLWHTAAQRPGVILQLVLLVVIAYVIARRVDFETAAKERAEAANARLERAQRALEDYVRLATEAQEEERKRLARELHDDTIQSILVAKTEVDAIGTEEQLPPGTATRLQRVASALEAAVDDVRRFSRDLRPSLLDDLGLVHAIDWLVADLAARTGIDARLETGGEPRRLDQSQEVALFRIIQEALHNVERHAGASTVEVRIEFGDGLRATVTDDGRGFDVRGAFGGRPSPDKLGLLGIRERAKLAGAELSITSDPPSGTCVSIALQSAA